MKVRDVIKSKGFEVIAIEEETTVGDAIKKMVERNIGALLVVNEKGKPVGIVTERDLLKCWAREGRCENAIVKNVMSKDLLVAQLDDDISYAMTVMIQRKVRHLPVLDKGRVVSVLSIRDLVRAHVSDLQAEVQYLKDYITDKYPA